MATVSSPTDKTINYAFLLGGVAALIFGIILLVRQEEALALLMVILGLWWLIQGAFMIFAIFVDREDMGWKLAIGVLGVVAGFLVLTNPGEAADVFQGAVGVVLGIIGILVGLASLIGAFRGGGVGAFVFGAVSILIGVLILLNAQFSTSLLITLFAILLLIDGVMGIYLALKYR
ncbi:MAG: HdeD family acid-resistance protein [Acidimicrobiia bacterium]